MMDTLNERIERALMKVPKSDFLGIFKPDIGYRLMGIRKGKQILNFFPDSANIKFFINFYDYQLKDNSIVKK